MADLKGGADSREEVLSDYRVYHLTGQEWIRYLLEGTAVGRVVMTGCLVVYLLAWRVSGKILQIEV